jgi:hypothetical protein
MIHTYKSMQGLKIIRRFARDDMDLRVRNGAKVAALAVNNYSLSLPSGLVLELNNCYFVPVVFSILLIMNQLRNVSHAYLER